MSLEFINDFIQESICYTTEDTSNKRTSDFLLNLKKGILVTVLSPMHPFLLLLAMPQHSLHEPHWNQSNQSPTQHR